MSETIEDAFAALGVTLRWESRVAMCRDVDGDDVDLGWLEEEHDAARALALAVLEAALVGARYVPDTEVRWIAELRAKIEALGR